MKLWTVKSDRNGVKIPVERTPQHIHKGLVKTYYDNDGKHEVKYTKYKFDYEFPFEIDIEEGSISSDEHGYGSGTGDLWAWSYYSTTSKKDAENYFKNENLRVVNKYGNNNTKLLIEKYSERLTNLKENMSKEMDVWSQDMIDQVEARIRDTAEFIRYLKNIK